MNTFSAPKKKVLESIGGLDAWTILDTAYSVKKEGYGVFDNKNIADIGAWLSPLLSIIQQHAKPSFLIAVDPIYAWKEEEAIRDTEASVKQFINDILGSDQQEKSNFLHIDAERQLQDIRNFSRVSGVKYLANVNEIYNLMPQDIVFVSSLLYALKKPKELLCQIDGILKKKGEIVITDFMFKGEIRRKLEEAGISVTNIDDQYFYAVLRKGDCYKIANDTISY